MTVMPPDVREDEDTFILENLDFDPVCEVTSMCSDTAVWLLARSCCDLVMGICEPHHVSTVEFMKTGRLMYCKACGTEKLNIDDFTWTKL